MRSCKFSRIFIATIAIVVGLVLGMPQAANAAISYESNNLVYIAKDTDILPTVGDRITISANVDEANRTITYKIVFNKDYANWGLIGSPGLRLFLASGLDEDSISISRYYYKTTDSSTKVDQTTITKAAVESGTTSYVSWFSGSSSMWDAYSKSVITPIDADSGYTTDAITFRDYWSNGNFSVGIEDSEGGNNTFYWTVTATYNEGVDPYSLPIIASYVGHLNYTAGETDIATLAYLPTGSTASSTDINVPDDKTVVDDKDNLTDDEKTEVEDSITDANPDLPSGTEITIGDDGTATIEYPDGSTDTIDGDDLVIEQSDKPAIDEVDTDDTSVTGTGVAGSTITVTFPDGTTKTTTVSDDGSWSVDVPSGVTLSKDDEIKATQTETDKSESEEVTTTVTKGDTTSDTTADTEDDSTANTTTDTTADSTDETTTDTVDDTTTDTTDGTTIDTTDDTTVDTTTETEDDTTTDTIADTTTDTTTETTDDATTDTTADTTDLNVPDDKTEVDDEDSLTDDEKTEVVDSIEDANPDLPSGTDVRVGDDGTATVEYSDGSTDTIDGDDLTEEKQSSSKSNSTNSTIVSAKSNSSNGSTKTGSTSKTTSKKVSSAPKTGDSLGGTLSLAAGVGTLAMILLGLFVHLRKNHSEQ